MEHNTAKIDIILEAIKKHLDHPSEIKEFKKGEHSTAEWLLWIKYNLTEAKYYFSEFKAQSDPLNKLYLIAIQAILCIAQNGGDEKTLKIALH